MTAVRIPKVYGHCIYWDTNLKYVEGMIIVFIVVNRDTPMLDPGWTRMHWLHNIAQAPDSLRRIQFDGA